MCHDQANPNVGTAAQHNEGLFAMPEVPSTNEEMQKKARRGRPKSKKEGTQSDGSSPLRNIKPKQNEKKRKRVREVGLSSATDDDESNWESFIEDEGIEPVKNQSFERLLQRIIRLENSKKRCDQKIKDLENEIKIVKTTAEKRISSLTNTVNKLLDQVKVLQSSPTPLVQPLGAPALDINNCWLSSAEKLGLKKTATTVPKPTQLEIKITNSILSEQADLDRRKKKIVIFGIPVHSSSTTKESA